jgi:hypothetical protein
MLCVVLLEEFYADPQRAGSEEFAFGSSWRSQGEGRWKIVWLEATGEVVAFSETAGWEPSGFGGDVGVVLEAAAEGVARLFRHGATKPHPEHDEVVIISMEQDLLRLRGALLA